MYTLDQLRRIETILKELKHNPEYLHQRDCPGLCSYVGLTGIGKIHNLPSNYFYQWIKPLMRKMGWTEKGSFISDIGVMNAKRKMLLDLVLAKAKVEKQKLKYENRVNEILNTEYTDER